MAGTLADWIDYQRRHLPAPEFDAWVAAHPRVQATIDREGRIPTTTRRLEALKRDIVKKVMAPSIERASKYLADIEKAQVPRRTGTLRLAVGSTKPKVYLASLTSWVASGPRRGYGRIILASVRKGRMKLLRTSKKFTEANQGSISTYANPIKYAHFLITGRRASTAGTRHGRDGATHTGKRALFDAFTGRFFGRSVREVAPRDFMAPAAAQTDTAASIATMEMAARMEQILPETT